MADYEDHGAAVFDAIARRQSAGLLIEPAPSRAQILRAVQAAVMAPDHRRLRPWRFIAIEGAGLDVLGESFIELARRQGETDPDKLARLRTQPWRSPQILVAVNRIQEHERVPDAEQILSMGAAVQNLMLVLAAQGFGSHWRTGMLAHNRDVARALGLADNEHIAGFIATGTVAKALPDRGLLEPADFLSQWPPPLGEGLDPEDDTKPDENFDHAVD